MTGSRPQGEPATDHILTGKIDHAREWAKWIIQADSQIEVDPDLRVAADVILALLPDPTLRTLADMTPDERALNLVRRFNPEARHRDGLNGKFHAHTSYQGHLLTVVAFPGSDRTTIRIYREMDNNRVERSGDMTADDLDVLEEFARQIIHNNHQ